MKELKNEVKVIADSKNGQEHPYADPQVTVILLPENDVITTSNGNDSGFGADSDFPE